MTINKLRYLQKNVLSHGQVYVVLIGVLSFDTFSVVSNRAVKEKKNRYKIKHVNTISNH